MKKVLLFFSIGLGMFSHAQTTTWTENIASIFYENCTKCHHNGGLGGSSFLEYSEVVAYKNSIRYQIESKTMPPWPADPSYRHYADERVLTPVENKAILDWIDNQTPMGDISKAPAKPNYTSNSKIGGYDLKITIPTYTSTAKTGDIYRCFSIPTNLPSNKFIAAVEILPGNAEIVHHVLVYQDTTSNTDNLDNADPLPGYTNFGGTGSANSILIAPYVPGSDPIIFPSGTGVKMFKNARIILQIHYPAGSHDQIDSTSLLIRFTDKPSIREVFIAPILHHGTITNGPFAIAKDQIKTFFQSYTVPIDVTLLSVMPHMHLIGKSTKVFVKPSIGDTIPLVKINDWDFHWQGQYRFQYLQKISAGSKLQSIVTYDNTINNPNNPSNPTKAITLGEATTSEMMLTFFYYMQYKTGDEKILQDSSLILSGITQPKATKIGLYQNPVHEFLKLGIPIEDAEIFIYDEQGRMVLTKVYKFEKSLNFKLELMHMNVGKLVKGHYTLVLHTKNGSKVFYSKFIKL